LNAATTFDLLHHHPTLPPSTAYHLYHQPVPSPPRWCPLYTPPYSLPRHRAILTASVGRLNDANLPHYPTPGAAEQRAAHRPSSIRAPPTGRQPPSLTTPLCRAVVALRRTLRGSFRRHLARVLDTCGGRAYWCLRGQQPQLPPGLLVRRWLTGFAAIHQTGTMPRHPHHALPFLAVAYRSPTFRHRMTSLLLSAVCLPAPSQRRHYTFLQTHTVHAFLQTPHLPSTVASRRTNTHW